MDILVCIKQVPATSEVNIDEETGVIIRSGVDSKMNPYDLFALEAALQLKESYGASVDVISMGPPQAEEVLKEAVSIGADRGALISDRAFGGADVLATSYTISQGIKKFGNYDLILCGKQTTDGDTAQVGAEIAEALDIDHASCITEIKDITSDGLTAIMNLGETLYVQKMKFPCLLTIEKDANVPRLPSYLRKKETKDDKNEIISLTDFADQNKKHYGLSGSPTSVEKVFPPDKNVEKKTLSGTPKEMAKEICDEIKAKKIIN